MHVIASSRDRDPKLTEEFLMGQEEVVDASVWVDGQELRAHVTLASDAQWDQDAIQKACRANVGARQTPTDIVLMKHRTRKA